MTRAQREDFDASAVSLSDHIRATVRAHPHFMSATSFDIDHRPGTERLLFGGLVVRERDGEMASENEMGGQTCVFMWWIVSVWSVGPSEDMTEVLAGFGFGLFLRRPHGVRGSVRRR